MNIMIIPAAGRGTRLSFDGPKLLYPLAGKPLIHHLIERYKPFVDKFIVVINPDCEQQVLDVLTVIDVDFMIEYQAKATGMLDAIIAPMNKLEKLIADRIHTVWISWCDQVSITTETAQNVANKLSNLAESNLDGYQSEFMTLPTAQVEIPYIHMQRDEQGKITQVLQRRENDLMPEIGENDCGLFAMSARAYFKGLREFADIDQSLSSNLAPGLASNMLGQETQERNFLPFITWLHQRADVQTFSAHHPIETVGINTVEDAKKIIDSWEEQS